MTNRVVIVAVDSYILFDKWRFSASYMLVIEEVQGTGLFWSMHN